MLFDELSFHDSVILSVTEYTQNQMMDFVLDFPVEWENNLFEKKVMRFSGVVFYLKKEIPFSGYPVILEIKTSEENKSTYAVSPGQVVSSRHKIEMVTNAGLRIIQFDEVTLLEYA